MDCVNYPVISTIQDAEFERLPRWFIEQCGQISTARRGEIILSKVGTPCFASVVHDYDEIALSRTVMGLVQITGINPYYLTAFLRCRYGFNQLLRQREQTIQYQLTLERVRELLVFVPTPKFQSAIEKLMFANIAKLQQADHHQTQAEQTLLRALGLEGWEPPEPLTYTRRASEALAAARFDAEYFAPRVAQLLAKLSADGLTIHDVAPARHDAFDASKHHADSFHYIEISGLRSDGTATSEPTPTDEAPSRASQKVHKGDIITSTVRPIRRLSAIIGPDQHEHVCSSGFVVLEPKAIPPEVLLTYLRLPIVCELMDLHTSASLYPAISERDLLKLPIPKIPEKAAQTIITQIRQAHHSRQEAQSLLAKAKRAVEVAIEEGEEKAVLTLKE
ncbi:MAG: hypothetical protein HS117_04550 [Verrucomicrobiaceae bacterium]|nr:hypothetical protein [Verrucomicrobiaceae bacterium]